MYSKILNPNTNRWININGKVGKSVLKTYLNQVGSGNIKFKKAVSIIIEMNRRFKQLSNEDKTKYKDGLGYATELINNGYLNIKNNVISINPESLTSIDKNYMTGGSIMAIAGIISAVGALISLGYEIKFKKKWEEADKLIKDKDFKKNNPIVYEQKMDKLVKELESLNEGICFASSCRLSRLSSLTKR